MLALMEQEFWERMDACTYGWVPLLSTLNYHNIVNQLNSK